MSRNIPNKPNCDLTYQVAEQFKHVALLQQGSMFMPDRKLWTPAHFEPLITHYVNNPIEGNDERGAKFWEKLPHQVGRCPPESVALCAEIFWLLVLPSSLFKPRYKLAQIDQIWAMAQPALPPLDKSSLWLDARALEGVGSTGTAFNILMWMELAYAIKLFHAFAQKPLAEREALLADPWGFAEWLDNRDETSGRQFYHILAHALFPDHFERVFSEGGKEQLARDPQLGVPKAARASRPARDEALLAARERLEKEYPDQAVDYYVFPALLGRQRKQPVEDDDLAELLALAGAGTRHRAEPDDTADIAPARPWRPRNRIFFGPPGSGKTRAMELIRAYRYKRGERVEVVSFHPTYAYEDFVEGYRPAPGQGGQLSERPVPGPFRRICESAHRHPDVRHTLFIDEINRANVAKVFGELITLIEPSKRCAPTPTLEFSEARSAARLQYSGDMLAVPANLDIIATMNTADRSVQSMDRALRRRFEFVETPADPKALQAEKVDGVDLRALLAAINDRIEFLIDGEHAIGHALLVDVRNLWDLRRAFARRVIPLLQEYFFEDLSKARLALTGSSKESVFFEERVLRADRLFDESAELDGIESRLSIRPAPDPSAWTAADFIRLYRSGGEAGSAIAALPPAGNPDDEDGADEEFEDRDELDDRSKAGQDGASV
jgi:5-methylcytosine-specific restriction protein B